MNPAPRAQFAGRDRPDLPETARWLSEGGDQRIALAPGSGCNRYGCPPFPDPGLHALGSCTASVISETGYRAADALRQQLAVTPAWSSPSLLARQGRRQMAELARLLGLSGLGADLLPGASGTDIHGLAARLAGRMAGKPLGCVLMEDAETGSGVAEALATGPENFTPSLSRIRLRDAKGHPRSPADIDRDTEAAVSEVLDRRHHCLLVTADLSKSGLIAPSPAIAIDLKRRHPQSLTVLVDACQMRLAPESLLAYLQQGFWLGLTGSKFLSGPTFAGALALPRQVAEMPLVREMTDQVHPGLLLRWEAALEELRAFSRIPRPRIDNIVLTLVSAFRRLLSLYPELVPLEVPAIHRPFGRDGSWDRQQTVFPFIPGVRNPTTGQIRLLSREQTQRLHRQLPIAHPEASHPSAGLRCQLGQPVACGHREGRPLGALRLCIGSRLVVAADRGNLEAIVKVAQRALEKTVWLAAEIAGPAQPRRLPPAAFSGRNIKGSAGD